MYLVKWDTMVQQTGINVQPIHISVTRRFGAVFTHLSMLCPTPSPNWVTVGQVQFHQNINCPYSGADPVIKITERIFSGKKVSPVVQSSE